MTRINLDNFTLRNSGPITETWDADGCDCEEGPTTGTLTIAPASIDCTTIGAPYPVEGGIATRFKYEMDGYSIEGENCTFTYRLQPNIWRRHNRRIGRIVRRRKNRSRH